MGDKEQFWKQEDGMERYRQASVVSDDQKLDWEDTLLLITSLTYARKPHVQTPLAEDNSNINNYGLASTFYKGRAKLRLNGLTKGPLRNPI